MNVHLHIERLVLDGVSLTPDRRDLLQATIQNELSRLLSNGGLSVELQAGGAAPRVSGGHIQVGRTDPIALGTQIGQAVYAGIGK